MYRGSYFPIYLRLFYNFIRFLIISFNILVMKNKSEDYKLTKNIEKCGDYYYEEHLSSWDKEKLERNWWEALKFFFSHSFMRGRRDKLSNEYNYFTRSALETYFSINNETLETSYIKLKKQVKYLDKDHILDFKKRKNIGRKNSIKEEDFNKEVKEKNPILKLLLTKKDVEIEWKNEKYKKKIFLGNDEDLMMVLDVLKFISEDNKKNIYNYLKYRVITSGIKSTYDELLKIIV